MAQAYGGGLVRADYVITTSGRFQLDIALDGVPLGGGSPYTFLVRPAPTSIRQSTVFGSISSCQVYSHTRCRSFDETSAWVLPGMALCLSGLMSSCHHVSRLASDARFTWKCGTFMVIGEYWKTILGMMIDQ